MPYARGFANQSLLIWHCNKHGFQFGTNNPRHYERLAIRFFQVDLADTPNLLECCNEDGDVVRFNPVTDEFGVMQVNGIIRTYFKPIPERLAPPGFDLKRTHIFDTNLEYYDDNCYEDSCYD